MFLALRLYGFALIVAGFVVLISAAIGIVVTVFELDTWVERIAFLLIGAPVVLLFSLAPLAAGQALLALSMIFDRVILGTPLVVEDSEAN